MPSSSKQIKMPWFRTSSPPQNMKSNKNKAPQSSVPSSFVPSSSRDENHSGNNSNEDLQQLYKTLQKDFVILREKYEATKNELNTVLWEIIPKISDKFEVLRDIETVTSLDGRTFKDLVIKEKIGDGKSSSVYLCQRKIDETQPHSSRSSEKPLVVKIIDKTKIVHFRGIDRLKNELNVGTNFLHPLISKIKNIYQTKHKLLVLMDKATTDLFEFSSLYETRPDEAIIQEILSQLVEALDFCHQNKICHRDIKTENILVDLNESTELQTVKLCDFGLSSIGDNNHNLREFCGSPGFFAPEVMLTRHKGFNGYKADIWSLGCVLLELVIGQGKFGDLWLAAYDKYLYEPQKFENAIKQELKQILSHLDCSSNCENFLRSMLQFDPSLRATCSDLKAHPWLNIKKKSSNGQVDLSRQPRGSDEVLPDLDTSNSGRFKVPVRRPRLTRLKVVNSEDEDEDDNDIYAEVDEELSNLNDLLLVFSSHSDSGLNNHNNAVSQETFLKGRNSILLVKQKIADNIREQNRRSNLLVERLLSMGMNSMKHTISEISEIGAVVLDEIKRLECGIFKFQDSDNFIDERNCIKNVNDYVKTQQKLCNIVAISSLEVVQAAKMEAGIFSVDIKPVDLNSSIQKAIRMIHTKLSESPQIKYFIPSFIPRQYIVNNDENLLVEFLVMLLSFANFFIRSENVTIICKFVEETKKSNSLLSNSTENSSPTSKAKIQLGILIKPSQLQKKAFQLFKKITLSKVLEQNMSEGASQERLAQIFFIRANMCAKRLQRTEQKFYERMDLQSGLRINHSTDPSMDQHEVMTEGTSSTRSSNIENPSPIMTKSPHGQQKNAKGLELCEVDPLSLSLSPPTRVETSKELNYLFVELSVSENSKNQITQSNLATNSSTWNKKHENEEEKKGDRNSLETSPMLVVQWRLDIQGHIRILVADDSKTMRQMMVTLFQRLVANCEGLVAEVYTALSAEEAFRMTKQFKFHFILMDEHFCPLTANVNDDGTPQNENSTESSNLSQTFLSIVLNGDKEMDTRAKKVYFETEQQKRRIFPGDGEMTGSRAIKLIRSEETKMNSTEKTIIITCSGQDECSDMNLYIDAGTNAILSKPYVLQDFIRNIERTIPDLVNSGCVIIKDDIAYLWGKLRIASKK